MKNFIKKTIIFFSLIAIFFASNNLLALGNLDDVPVNDGAKKVSDIGSSAGYSINVTATDILSRVVQVVIGLSGTIAVGLVIFAGFKYLLSKGKPEEIKKALSLMSTGFIGIVLMMSAYTVSSYVIKQTKRISGVVSPSSVSQETESNSATQEQINLCSSKTTEFGCTSSGCIFTNSGCYAKRSLINGAVCFNDNSNLCISGYCSGDTGSKVCLDKFSKPNTSSCYSNDDCMSKYCGDVNGSKVCLIDPNRPSYSACNFKNYHDFSDKTLEELMVREIELCQFGYDYERNLFSVLFGGSTSNCAAVIPAKDRLVAVSYSCHNASEEYECRICVSDRCSTNTSEEFCQKSKGKCKWVNNFCERTDCFNATTIETCSSLTKCKWSSNKCIEK